MENISKQDLSESNTAMSHVIMTGIDLQLPSEIKSALSKSVNWLLTGKYAQFIFRIELFGSCAREEARSDSDIDMVVYLANSQKAHQVLKTRNVKSRLMREFFDYHASHTEIDVDLIVPFDEEL